jgi:hypothetical protein
LLFLLRNSGYNGKKIDVKNAFEYMKAIINFLEGCDSMLDAISDYESEMHSYYDYYLPDYESEMISYDDYFPDY